MSIQSRRNSACEQGLNIASDSFTDTHTNRERDTQWVYTTTEEWATGEPQKRYQRRYSQHTRERGRRGRLREIEG